MEIVLAATIGAYYFGLPIIYVMLVILSGNRTVKWFEWVSIMVASPILVVVLLLFAPLLAISYIWDSVQRIEVARLRRKGLEVVNGVTSNKRDSKTDG